MEEHTLSVTWWDFKEHLWTCFLHAQVMKESPLVWSLANPLWLAMGWNRCNPGSGLSPWLQRRSASGWVVFMPLWIPILKVNHIRLIVDSPLVSSVYSPYFSNVCLTPIFLSWLMMVYDGLSSCSILNGQNGICPMFRGNDAVHAAPRREVRGLVSAWDVFFFF